VARVCSGEKGNERDKTRVFFISWFVIWVARVFGGKRGSERDKARVFYGLFL